MTAIESAPVAAPRVPIFRWFYAAAAAAVILVSALVPHGWLESARGVQIVSVQANGGVHLRWKDAGKRRYQVLRSTDPADFSRAERRVVEGTQFVDLGSGEGRVVYYKVE